MSPLRRILTRQDNTNEEEFIKNLQSDAAVAEAYKWMEASDGWKHLKAKMQAEIEVKRIANEDTDLSERDMNINRGMIRALRWVLDGVRETADYRETALAELHKITESRKEKQNG